MIVYFASGRFVSDGHALGANWGFSRPVGVVELSPAGLIMSERTSEFGIKNLGQLANPISPGAEIRVSLPIRVQISTRPVIYVLSVPLELHPIELLADFRISHPRVVTTSCMFGIDPNPKKRPMLSVYALDKDEPIVRKSVIASIATDLIR